MTIYLAAALFSQAERLWNRSFVAALSDHLASVRFILPQEFIAARGDALGSLHAQCMASLRDADAVIAILDGPDVDCGVAWEMGYASARGKPVIGVRTDLRESQEQGVNLMLSRGCAHVVRSRRLDDDVAALAGQVAQVAARLLAGLAQAGPEPLARRAADFDLSTGTG